jgi:sec-independent protein translocase protein TatA
MFPGGIGMPEMIVLGVIALLLFGKRLPEVARSVGKGIVEFKKGVSGIEDEVRTAAHSRPSASTSRPEVEDEEPRTNAPKFEPPRSEPKDEETPASP